MRERAWGRSELDRIGYEGGAAAAGAIGGAGGIGARTAGSTSDPAPRIDLSGQEFEMLHDFLARREGLTPEARARIANSMALLFRRSLSERGVLPDSWSGLGSEAFLLTLDASFRGDPGDPAEQPLFGGTARLLGRER